MGGHEHGHHGPPYVVPSADSYKIEDAPQLMELQKRLEKHGLKDPWARNHVWRYQKKFGNRWTRGRSVLLTGVPLGVAAFVVTLAIENVLGIDYHPWHHHDAHGEHGKDH